jgi:PilZ domain
MADIRVKAARGSKCYMLVPTGRNEKRTPKAVYVEVLRLDESQPMKMAVTENVSPRGARIVTEYDCPPGKQVVITALEEGVRSLARVVYCEPVESSRFAVGLQLVLRVEGWGKPVSRV